MSIPKREIYTFGTPDISKLDPEATYYITYDSNGENPKIEGRIDKIQEPKDWYDYENKKWANIVTITGDATAYWTWIPRYVYKISNEKDIDLKFVSTNNECKDSSGQIVDVSSYLTPDAFSFSGQQLPGFWASKYVVDTGKNSDINFFQTSNTIKIYEQQETSNTYQIFVDSIYYNTSKLPVTISGLEPNRVYEITVFGSNGDAKRKKICTADIVVDITGLDLENTYYVTWDEQKNEIHTPISQEAPKDWYDYENKKWANIVTKANGVTAYWVWIPRYEYIIDTFTNKIDVLFIPATVQQPLNREEKIPEAFIFADKQLSGYWASKYYVSESV